MPTLHEIFPQNLSKILERRGMSQTELAEKLNVSDATVSYWIKGQKVPRMDKLANMADILGVTISILTEENGFEIYDKSVLPGIINISDISWKKVPVIGSMAAGDPINDKEFPDVYCDAPTEADFALKVKGDSMEPSFLEGDTVFVRQCPDLPCPGAVVVISIDHDYSIKHVTLDQAGAIVTSDNPAYPPKLYSSKEHEISILGIPVGFLRMFK